VTEMIEPMTAQVDQQQFGRELVGKARAVGGLVEPGVLLTGLMKLVLNTTAGHKGNRCQLYCRERPRWTQSETQRHKCPLSNDHGVRCLCC